MRHVTLLAAICLVFLSACNGEVKIDRRGDLLCQKKFEVPSPDHAEFIQLIENLGRPFNLIPINDVATEFAYSEQLGREGIFYYLVSRQDSDDILVVSVHNAISDNLFVVQVYAGGLSSSATQQICRQLSSLHTKSRGRELMTKTRTPTIS